MSLQIKALDEQEIQELLTLPFHESMRFSTSRLIETIRGLKEYQQELFGENIKMMEEIVRYDEENKELLITIQKLKEENEKLRKALEFYGHWNIAQVYKDDAGKTAREALKCFAPSA